MQPGLVFTFLGLALAACAWTAAGLPLRLLWADLALCFLGVGAGFLWIGPRVFLKRPDGTLAPLSFLLFWPYHLTNALALAALRLTGKERPVDEILPGLFLGRRLLGTEATRLIESGEPAVLDLAAELSEHPAFRSDRHYHSLPLLDASAPTAAELAEGVRFIREHLPHGPVFVHCALGHGRSATFIAAYLLAWGAAADPAAAEAMIRERRPGVGLKPSQRAALAGLLKGAE